MSDEIPEKLTFTQEAFDKIIGERVLRERDKNTESYNSLTAENTTLKDKLAKIEIDGIVQSAGLPLDWASRLVGKSVEEAKIEVQTLKALVEKSKPAPEKIGADTNPANTTLTLITRESLKKMTAQEINDRWLDVQRALKSGI